MDASSFSPLHGMGIIRDDLSYKKNIVKKPWGYEYLAYENEEVALWALYIKKGHRTSMHCHSNKTTGLVALSGKVEVSFLNNKNELSALNKIMIRKGLFHSTQALLDPGSWVLEIETPVNKNDLVRLRDSYGRQGKPYEDASFEYPKKNDCIWIENPHQQTENVYSLGDSKLTVSRLFDVSVLKEMDEHKNVMFLQGGVTTDYDINVAGAGDVVSAKILKELIEVFTKIKKDTVIMVMDKND